jgi:hypothetical protein
MEPSSAACTLICVCFYSDNLTDEAKKLVKNIAIQYVYLRKMFAAASKMLPFDMRAFTWQSFRWAVSILMTRQNAIPSLFDSKNPVMALIPLWDFCNHTHGKVRILFRFCLML